MHSQKPLVIPCDVAYRYDGGLSGLYTCIHACVYSGQLPMEIAPEAPAQPTLLPTRYIPTDPEKADRVRDAIQRKIALRAQEMVEDVFLSCLPDKEIRILRFLLLGFREGKRVLRMLDHMDVEPLYAAEKHLFRETHHLCGFIRFEDHGGRLIATIRPKNFVLPFLADHFIDRLSSETFMIFDRTHGAALIHEPGRSEIVRLEGVEKGNISEEEARYQALWRRFYKTIAIESRVNHRLRQGHMPKRFWPEMTEMKGQE